MSVAPPGTQSALVRLSARAGFAGGLAAVGALAGGVAVTVTAVAAREDVDAAVELESVSGAELGAAAFGAAAVGAGALAAVREGAVSVVAGFVGGSMTVAILLRAEPEEVAAVGAATVVGGGALGAGAVAAVGSLYAQLRDLGAV